MVRLPLSPAELERGERLGALLRGARGTRSMVEVAAAAAISPETLRKIETGRIATPSFSTIAAIASALGLSLDGLWASLAAQARTASPEGRPAQGRGDQPSKGPSEPARSPSSCS